MKFAICNEIFQGWKLEDAMDYAARAGYDAIELAPFTLAKSVTDIPARDRQRFRESAARTGISICGLHWVLAETKGMYLNHSDPAVRRRTGAYFCELVDFCGDVGGRIITVGSPKQRCLLPGITKFQAWDWAAATLAESVKRAEARGVTICMEPLSNSETDFINTAEEAILFTKQFGVPHFQTVLDVKAMCAEAKPIPQIIRESSPHIAHFHANDRNLKGPGFGEIDFTPIAGALEEVKYNGCVSVEVFNFEEGPKIIASQSIDYLKRVFRTNDAH